MQKEKLVKLASEKSKPCVTISMNTHRTHPENIQDTIVLKKMCKEAEERLISEFGKRPILPLLESLEQISTGMDMKYNLDSQHIFLSNDTKEIIKSSWPASENSVQISETFAIGPLIKSANKDFEYLILLLSQSGVKMLVALNNTIVGEIENDYFPFTANPHFNTEPNKINDPKSADNKVREYFNTVDKAVVKVFNQTNLNCMVICTGDNYSRLLQVADKPGIYKGHTSVDYNNQSHLQIGTQAWEIMKEQQVKNEKAAIDEMREAEGHGKTMSDLFKIYLAIKEGRGDLLIIYNDFRQAVKITGESSFDLVDDPSQPDVIDDIANELARLVLSKKGRVVFTDQQEIKELGDIVLKIRY
jgi:hypothetical protein